MEFYNSLINQYLTSWYPPTQTTTLGSKATLSISSIDPTNTRGLQLTFLNLQRQIQTETNSILLYHLSKQARGAIASYTIIKNELILESISSLETGGPSMTSNIDMSQITSELINSTLNLKQLEWDSNLYAMELSVPFNLLFTIIFLIILFYQLFIIFRFKSEIYFSTCMLIGFFLEFIGYLSRSIAHYDYTNPNLYLCQIISLTIAPAFIMASIYYLLAKLVIIYGVNFSKLSPIVLSYIFIICDVLSLVIQAIGGAIAAINLRKLINSNLGSWIMLSGIIFQCFSMTIFIIILTIFLINIYNINSPLEIVDFFRYLINIGNEKLEHYYDPRYKSTRKHSRFFNYVPLAILLSVLFVYVRCIYRVIELSQGWRGYLITHEEYVLSLDALMVCLTSLIYIPFHPCLIFGNKLKIKLRNKTSKIDNDLEIKIKKTHLISQPYLNPKLKIPKKTESNTPTLKTNPYLDLKLEKHESISSISTLEYSF